MDGNGMEFRTEITVELTDAHGALTVPWTDRDGRVAYVDLRRQPERIGEIPEAREHAELAELLLRLNGLESAWATAKCDCWVMDAEELEAASYELEMVADSPAVRAGVGTYVDIYLLDAERFESLAHQRALLGRLVEGKPRDDARAMAEFVLRRCVVADAEGFAITVFLHAVGRDEEEARRNWASAVKTLGGILESVR